MTLIKHEDIGAAGPGPAHSEAKGAKDLDCTLEQSSSHRKAKDIIRIKQTNRLKLDISFQRTIRVPDGKDDSELPPCTGTFPLYSVGNYADKLPENMAAKGELFFPLCTREAMWISFESEQPFAVQIFVGGVNAVSGEPTGDNEAIMMRRLSLMGKKKSIQDYVVTPKQLWLDGIATDNERVRQFVAMPLGSGYTVEAQVTGQDLVGGLQFHVTPSTPPARSLLICEPSSLTKSEIVALKGSNPPGFNNSPIQIRVKCLTGKSTPISAKTYADEGLPFYKIYGGKSTIKGEFNGIKSVKGLDKIKNENGKRDKEGEDALHSNEKAKDFSDEEDEDDSSEDDEEEDDSLNNDKEDSDEDDYPAQDKNSVNDDGDEQPLQNPTILLNPVGSAMGSFTPVSELMGEFSRMKLRNSKLLPAEG